MVVTYSVTQGTYTVEDKISILDLKFFNAIGSDV